MISGSKPLALIPAYSHIDHRLVRVLRGLGIPYMELYGCSDLVKARSSLLSEALKTDADRFLLIDSDILPSAEDVMALAESPKLDQSNAVCGCYVTGQVDHLAAYAANGPVELGGKERFVEMIVGGLGFAAR
jgi:hypothetical protein